MIYDGRGFSVAEELSTHSDEDYHFMLNLNKLIISDKYLIKENNK